jgi:hypothetical protein
MRHVAERGEHLADPGEDWDMTLNRDSYFGDRTFVHRLISGRHTTYETMH